MTLTGDPIKKDHEESPTSDLAEETGSDSSTHSSRHSPFIPVELSSSVSLMEDSRSVEKVQYGNGPKYYTNSHNTPMKDKHHYSVPYDPQVEEGKTKKNGRGEDHTFVKI